MIAVRLCLESGFVSVVKQSSKKDKRPSPSSIEPVAKIVS